MLCEDCSKRETCTEACPELEKHLKEQEVYMREMLVSPKELEWIASQLYTGDWYVRHPEYRGRLKKCLKKLLGEDRLLLEMKFEQGKNYREIGEICGMSMEQTRYRIRTILSKLEKEISLE